MLTEESKELTGEDFLKKQSELNKEILEGYLKKVSINFNKQAIEEKRIDFWCSVFLKVDLSIILDEECDVKPQQIADYALREFDSRFNPA